MLNFFGRFIYYLFVVKHCFHWNALEGVRCHFAVLMHMLSSLPSLIVFTVIKNNAGFDLKDQMK